MEHLRKPGSRAYSFLFGEYGGPPVDYLMAFALVYGVMVVLVARNFFALF